ncbi:MAG: two-component system sensor histidine kinase SenX3 [Arenicella sp.]|jgi:two-component system sensor histidine kinase SenX3
MTTQARAGKATVSLWLSIAVLLMGLLFLTLVIIEYQRNTSLIEQNRSLISGSAKTRLGSNLLYLEPSRNWNDSYNDSADDYRWIQHAPRTYWFNNAVQEFPWTREAVSNSAPQGETLQTMWAAVNSPSPTNLVNQERLRLLNSIKAALDDSSYTASSNADSANEKKTAIQQSFDAYVEHTRAYHLSPQQEIVFSLKLLEIGAQEHWSSELVHAILITGGSSQAPIVRSVVDLLFRHAGHFSNHEFDWVISKIQRHLEVFNLPAYFLDDYVSHLKKPRFALPASFSRVNKQLTITADQHWFLQQSSNTQISAEPIDLVEELQLVELEFIELGVLDNGDSLNFGDLSSRISLNDIGIMVNKTQLNKGQHNQLSYLVIKSIMLIAFMALVLLTLRLIEKNQQRRFEYLALREDFVKLVSHELKTPLAGIRAMAETLRKRVERGISVQAYPERIINEADKLWYMVDNILGFNRVQLTDAIIDKRPTKIKPICDAIVDDVRSFSNKPYTLSNTIDESAEVLVDPELFSLVVKNIIVNAGLYNDQATVEIELSFDEHEPCLLISDNGIGIADADRSKIFKPFVRLAQSARESARQSGTGLGLAICKRIMQLHGGDLSLAQSNQHGSVWKISLVK